MCVILLLILLTYAIQALASLVQLEPRNVTVLRGSEARFNCSTAEPWEVLTWLLGGRSVLTISVQHGILGDTGSFTAVNRSTAEASRWEFVLRSVALTHSGQVVCDLQNIQRQTASLFVQENGSVAISGGNVSARRGEEVLFHCQASGWYPEPRMSWAVNGTEVERARYNTSSERDSAGLFNSTSTLSIQAQQSSSVECQASVSALPAPQTNTVSLTVGLAEKDITVQIAVTSVCTIIVLVLLLICTVLCCERRRTAKSSHQDAIRVGHLESDRNSVAEETEGKVNLGYASEGHPGIGQSDLNDRAYSQTNAISAHKIPDVISSSNHMAIGDSNYRSSLSGDVHRTVRRVTTV